MLAVTVAAALLPVLLMAALGHMWFSRDAEHHLDTRLAADNRHWAAMLQQRVTVAQALLDGLAQSGSRPESASSAAVAGVLQALVQVNGAGQVLAGDKGSWAQWQQAPPAEIRAGTDAPNYRLRWLPAATGDGAARIFVGQMATDGKLWLAEVQPSYLWAGLTQDSADMLHCVTDARNRPLQCPTAAAQRSAQGAPGLRRSLYWSPEAGGSQWQIQSLAAPDGEPAAPDKGLFARILALAGGLTLTAAVGVAWWQWRRASSSLSQMMLGAQHWAGQNWEARIALPPDDELGLLAQELNRLAERTGQQIRAVEVQSAIDREILGGLDTHRILQLVLERLQALLPRARAMVVVIEPTQEGLNCWVIHRPGQAPVMAQACPTPLLMSDGDWAVTLRATPQLARAPAAAPAPAADGPPRVPVWAAKALGVPREWLNLLVWVPVRRQGQTLGYIALGSRTELLMHDDTRREIQDLRDRVAVTVTSAARESALVARAIHDALTGLLNRMGLQDAIDAMVALGEPFTLVLVDLDRFKEVNDTLGHQAGDELLCAVASRLRSCVAPQARISRPGGDEFVLLLPGQSTDATAAAMAICAELARPFPLRGVHQQIGGSLGLASFPHQAQTRGELMRRADLAMYVAKSEGRGRFSWYVEAMDERIAQRAWMAQELRTAVDRAHFVLHYQPRVEAMAGTLVCVEALLRWPHAQRGLIPPSEFVPAAEESGLIDRLGHWVLASAFEQMSQWRAARVPLERVAVNVSARQLMTSGFSDMVLDLMARYQLEPTDIELELTESVFAGDVDVVCRVLEPLRRVGIQLALDDFGTGYSSLSSLYRLPVDVIKIDHSFVRDLGVRPSAETMARSIVALAKALRKRVVAEGVETRAQRDHLLRLDCDELQGYLYGRPMSAADLERRIEELAAEAEAAARKRERRTAKT